MFFLEDMKELRKNGAKGKGNFRLSILFWREAISAFLHINFMTLIM